MNRAYFIQKLRDIYATFGKSFPGQEVVDRVFERVASMPELVMDVALSQLENEESLPANLGRYIALNVWPSVQAMTGRKGAGEACPKCQYGLPGRRFIYRGIYHYLAACECAGGPSDETLLAQGFSLEDPRQAEMQRGCGNEQD